MNTLRCIHRIHRIHELIHKCIHEYNDVFMVFTHEYNIHTMNTTLKK